MSSSTAPRRTPYGRAWLRALVLLLALLVPGTHAEVHAAPAVSGVSGETTVEYDILDGALRPPARTAHRPAAPLRPAPLPDPAPGAARGPACTAPLGSAYPPHPALSTVVLRC
ncbi:hypothetical protein ACFV0T_07315 [Streptomyces sp. NPDC059582]|uniref:hypothetical protein n=1 Tax=Streptomyces sp. NPDC059582 TaxID=3346875 RepID=UPI0036A89176